MDNEDEKKAFLKESDHKHQSAGNESIIMSGKSFCKETPTANDAVYAVEELDGTEKCSVQYPAVGRRHW